MKHNYINQDAGTTQQQFLQKKIKNNNNFFLHCRYVEFQGKGVCISFKDEAVMCPNLEKMKHCEYF